MQKIVSDTFVIVYRSRYVARRLNEYLGPNHSKYVYWLTSSVDKAFLGSCLRPAEIHSVACQLKIEEKNFTYQNVRATKTFSVTFL